MERYQKYKVAFMMHESPEAYASSSYSNFVFLSVLH